MQIVFLFTEYSEKKVCELQSLTTTIVKMLMASFCFLLIFMH